MDMGTDLLACFSRPKGANDRYLWPFISLRYTDAIWHGRVEFRWSCLIMIDTIQTNSKDIHPGSQDGKDKNLKNIA